MEASRQLQALADLPQSKEPPYPLNKNSVGPHSWSGRFAEVKNLFPHRKSRNYFSVFQPVV
jgi:hypothetical protein